MLKKRGLLKFVMSGVAGAVLLFAYGNTLAQEETVPPAGEQPAVEEGKWQKAGQEIKEAADAVGEASKDSAEKAWDATRDTSKKAWKATKETTVAVGEEVGEKSSQAWDATKDTSQKAWDATREKASEVKEKVQGNPSSPEEEVVPAPAPEKAGEENQ